MSRDLSRRLEALERKLPCKPAFIDMSHLSDRQLEIIERCVTGNAWDRDSIAALSDSEQSLLLAALKSLEGAGFYRAFCEKFGITEPFNGDPTRPLSRCAQRARDERKRLEARGHG